MSVACPKRKAKTEWRAISRGAAATHSPPAEIFDMKASHNPLADCVSDSISLFSLRCHCRPCLLDSALFFFSSLSFLCVFMGTVTGAAIRIPGI